MPKKEQESSYSCRENRAEVGWAQVDVEMELNNAEIKSGAEKQNWHNG